MDRRSSCSKPIWKALTSGTLGNGKWILAVLPAPREGKHTRRGCATHLECLLVTLPPGPGASSASHGPVLPPDQHLGQRPCPHPPTPHPEPWPPSHATGCHPAPHHTATGLWNCLPALEHNFGFPLGQEPKQICSCVSWRSSNPTTVLSSRNSPQSQYPSRPSSSWAKLLNLSCYWLRSIRLGSRRRGREDLHEILIYILHWLACQK